MTRTSDLSNAGVSIWLDDLSRDSISSGDLAGLIAQHDVVGVTTNPSIFTKAITGSSAYDAQLTELAGTDVDEALVAMTTDDVRAAATLFEDVYAATNGRDGRVSIEVDPRLAHDTENTIAAASMLWERVGHPGLFVKIPATLEGLPAITATIAAGISVNVTLIFSVDRYRAVLGAYLLGLEQALEAGVDLSTIRSVASVFLSRIDTAVDAALAELDGDHAALAGTAAIANARVCYEVYEEVLATPRWAHLAEAGAHPQRPLWASTSTKDPAYPDTMYVDELVGPNVVNTMPRATLEAVADHGASPTDKLTGAGLAAQTQLDAITAAGVDLEPIMAQLEADGVQTFVDAWEKLRESVREGLAG